jgi:NMD protein affecting ribosome stability and mRNA decay
MDDVKSSKTVVCSTCGRPIPKLLDQYGPLLHPVCRECYQDPPVLEEDDRRDEAEQKEMVLE